MPASLYLIDMHSAALRIKGMRTADVGDVTPVTGGYFINVPSDVTVTTPPVDVSDLLSIKYGGILDLYPTFGNITYDEQRDASGWTITPSTGIALFSLGDRKSTSVLPAGTLETVVFVLGGTPTSCVFRWEAYEYTYDSDAAGNIQRYYSELDPTTFTVQLSFNNGVNFNTVTYGGTFSIPGGQQGSQFIARFERGPGPIRAGLGSWALIY